jgi:hypothetical protein
MREQRPLTTKPTESYRTIRVNGKSVRYDGSKNPKAIAAWLMTQRASSIRERIGKDLSRRESEVKRSKMLAARESASQPQPHSRLLRIWGCECS